MTNPTPSAAGAFRGGTTSYSEVDLARGAAGDPGTELHLTDDGATLRRSILPGGVRVITESVPGLR